MGYKLPDARTIPTMTVFERPHLNSSQASLASKKSAPGHTHTSSSSRTLTPRGSSPDFPAFHNGQPAAPPLHHGTAEQLTRSTSGLDGVSHPYESTTTAGQRNAFDDLPLESTSEKPSPPPATGKGYQFWLIFTAVNVSTLLVAIDLSIIGTALPTIAADLNAKELFVWIGNAYVLSSCTVQPLFGQAANIFGRRSLTIASILLFVLGSALAGAAKNISMMIAARSVQGVGGGGIITMGEIIINDLLPLRERGQYTGILAGTYSIGTIIGPVLGGLFTQHVSWRWTFYINLPICAIALAISIPFLNLKYRREGTILDRLRRVDWAGNFVLVTAVSSILLALTWGGTKYTWGDWHVTLPLYGGVLGLIVFLLIQVSGYVEEPTMPPRLFANRTSVAIFIMAFFHGLLLIYVIYFLPVYFQAVKLSSPTRSGVQIFPIATTVAPAAAVCGILVTVNGRYRRFFYAGWALMAIGCGLFSLLKPTTSTAGWVCFQLVFGLGNGLVYNVMIPPLLASLGPAEIATATATWTFARAFGGIWGVAIPSAIFNGRINTLVTARLAATNPGLAAQLSNGGAYEHAIATFIRGLPFGVRATVIGIYSDALKTVWYASIAFAVIGLPLSLLVKRYDLSTVLEETDFGMDDDRIRAAALADRERGAGMAERGF